jgi:hypothetical protein
MADLREITYRLRRIGQKRPSPEARAEVAAALSNKWEGVQAVAAQVLGGWGDRESVELLRRFLVRCIDRKFGWSIRGVAVRALRPVVTEEDVDWILDLYFSPNGYFPKHELLWLVTALPPKATRPRLVAGLRDKRWYIRRAAVNAIGNVDYPDRQQLILQLSKDPDSDVRASVRRLCFRSGTPMI